MILENYSLKLSESLILYFQILLLSILKLNSFYLHINLNSSWLYPMLSLLFSNPWFFGILCLQLLVECNNELKRPYFLFSFNCSSYLLGRVAVNSSPVYTPFRPNPKLLADGRVFILILNNHNFLLKKLECEVVKI